MVGLNPTLSTINYFLSFSFPPVSAPSFLPISLPLSITFSFPPLSLPLFCFVFFPSFILILFLYFLPPPNLLSLLNILWQKYSLAVGMLGLEMWWISPCICLLSPSEWLVCLTKDQASIGHHISPLFQAAGFMSYLEWRHNRSQNVYSKEQNKCVCSLGPFNDITKSSLLPLRMNILFINIQVIIMQKRSDNYLSQNGDNCEVGRASTVSLSPGPSFRLPTLPCILLKEWF